MVRRYACGLDIIIRLYLSLFSQVELIFFRELSNTRWMDSRHCVGATFHTVLYRFLRNYTGVLVMVWKYACGLDIILRFFLSLFSQVELAIFRAFSITKWTDSGHLVVATPIVSNQFFRNFNGVLVIVWRYACGLDIILRLFFVTFFHKLNLAIFRALSITQWMDKGHIVDVTPPTVLYWFFGNFTGVLVMVWRYACGLDIILRLFFFTFSQVELSHFSGII